MRQAGGGDQLAVVVADEQVVLVGEGEVERGGDVLVGGAVGHRDGAAQQAQLVVGADEADELDPAALPASRRGSRSSGSGARRWLLAGLVGCAARGGAVAVLGVVEALERAGALGELRRGR